MPNIEILSKFDYSTILKAIKASNQSKLERDASVAPVAPGGSQAKSEARNTAGV
jgi:hypothetical protein